MAARSRLRDTESSRQVRIGGMYEAEPKRTLGLGTEEDREDAEEHE